MKAFPNEFESAGMDLRDYFAVHLLSGFLSCETSNDMDDKHLAKWSYEMADAMMEARQK